MPNENLKIFQGQISDTRKHDQWFPHGCCCFHSTVCEEAIIKLAKHTKDLTGQHNLCLAGGVALNCVANAKLKSQGLFDSIWVQPASGDAGGALGATLASFHLQHNGPRKAKK